MDEAVDIKRRDVTVPVKCGHCLFFKRAATYERPCLELGTVSAAKPCRRFVVDPNQLGSAEKFHDIFNAVANLASTNLLAATLLQASKVKKHGYTIGQKVYFKVLGKDFLNNYASGLIVGATKTTLVISGRQNFSAMLDTASVLDLEKWKLKRKSLIKRNLINDPTGLTKVVVRNKAKLEMYMPPMAKGKKSYPRKKAKPMKTVKTGYGKIIALS